jgi:peroxiredoxin
MPPLQPRLDTITANTRALVQPERLAITDTAVQNLLDSGIESRILSVGSPAPGFSLPAAQSSSFQLPAASKKLVNSADLLSLGPLIINFFRGRWCPYCVTELEAWQAAFPAVRERGALLIAISPQLPRQNDFLVQQHGLTFPVLSDPGAAVAASFGITYTVPQAMQNHYRSILVNIPFIHGDQGENTWRLPLPATFVVQPTRSATGEVGGTITFAEAYADHRVRPDPLDVLAAL